GPELGRRLDAEAAALVEGAERAGDQRTAQGKLKNDSHVLVRRQDVDRLVNLMVADGVLQGALAVKGDGAPEGDLALRRERHVQRRLAAFDGVVQVLDEAAGALLDGECLIARQPTAVTLPAGDAPLGDDLAVQPAPV